MLAKCPNTVRVLRLLNFGKQKFFNASVLKGTYRRHFCTLRAKFWSLAAAEQRFISLAI